MKLILIAICLVSFTSHGQERINRGKLEFLNESMVLNKSEGWPYNNAIGEWVDYSNLICSDKTYKSSDREYKIKYNLSGTKLMSRIYQNFNSLQIKSLLFNNT